MKNLTFARGLSAFFAIALAINVVGGSAGAAFESLDSITADDLNAIVNDTAAAQSSAAAAQDTANTAVSDAAAAQSTADAALPAASLAASETDPTVPASIKDGIDWSELTGIPADFADGVDNNDAKLTEAEVDAFVANNGYLTTETDPSVNAAAKANLSTCAEGDVLLLGSLGWECSTNVSGTGKWSDGATSGDIVYTGGNVGIGTDSPAASLEINSYEDDNLLIHSASATGWSRIALTREGETDHGFLGYHGTNSQDTSSGMMLGATGEHVIRFHSNGNDQMTIYPSGDVSIPYGNLSVSSGDLSVPNGNVGIGTSSPVATLDVNGSFMAANEHVYSSIVYNIGGTGTNQGAAILEWKEGTTILDRGHVYKVQVFINSDTSLPTSATYLVRDKSLYASEVIRKEKDDDGNWIEVKDENGDPVILDDGIPEWEVRTVNDISSGFGQVLEVIMKDGATPDDHESQLQLSSDYSSPYTFRYIVTAIETNNNNVHYGIFGADGIWQRSEADAYYLDGDVGIGTTEPGAKLEVHEVIRIGASDTEREGGELQLMTSDGSARWNLDAYKDRFRIHGGTARNEKFSITDSGNVGIGTGSPDAKLDVEGSLQADTFTGEASIYTHAQDITTSGAVDVEYFSIDIHGAPRSSAAFVNEVSGTVDIHYFDYSGAGLTVGEFQPATTITGFTSPNDAESFLHNNITYLVVGDDSDAAILHQWDGTNFVAITGKEIPTTGHTDTEVFYIDGQQVIALAQSGEIDIRTWDGSEYSKKDPINLDGVQKLHFFEADLNADDATEGYLAAATASGLTIYQWEEGQGYYVFSEFATLDAPSAQNAHYFVVDDRQFLMVPSDRDDIDSPLYEWNGAEFEVAQTFDTYSGSVAATNFALNGTQYLVLAAKGQSTNDYLLFYWYEDDQFNYRRMIVSDNTSGGLADIELSLTDGEYRLILVEGNISRVLRIEHATNAKIADDLWVAGQDIMMDDMNATQGTSAGISYDDYDALGSEGVFSFHADQERRPGWNDPGAAISAKGGYFSGNVGIGTSSPVATLDVNGSFMAANEHVYSSIVYNIGGTGTNQGAAILEWKEGTTILDRGHVYKVQVFINSDTSLPTSATYLVRDKSLYASEVIRKEKDDDGNWIEVKDENGDPVILDDGIPEWEVRTVNDISSGFGQVLEVIMKDGATPDDHESQLQLSSDYSSPYTFRYIVTAIETNNNNVHYGIFGADGIWQRSEADAYYLDGDVGIGTTSPAAKLEVAGSGTRLSGTMYTTSPSESILGWSNETKFLSEVNVGDYILFSDGQGGIVTAVNSDNSLKIDKSIYLSSGTTATVVSKPAIIVPQNAGFVGIGTSTPSALLEVAGTALATSWDNTSDSRLKTAVTTIPSALEKILSLRGVTFEWKQEEFPERNFADGTQVGLIAQEVEKVFPELVSQGEYKSVSYASLVSPLIEAVKELHALYQGHADRIAALEAQNQQLLETIAALQERDEAFAARIDALEAAQ